MIVIVANKEGINQIDNKNNGSYIIASGYGLVVSITIGNAGCGIITPAIKHLNYGYAA